MLSGPLNARQLALLLWRSYGEGTADAIDRAVQKLIDDAFQTAQGVLTRNRAILDAGARELLERETLAQEDLAKLTAGLKRVAPPKSAAAE